MIWSAPSTASASCSRPVSRCTNPTRAVRAPWIALARARGFPVVGYWFDVPLADALARNAGREGKRRIPDNALESTQARLQPPQLDEGFERVFRVRVIADVSAGQHRWVIEPSA